METPYTRSKNFQLILRLSCFLIFLGRAWQHLLWDAPFRAFFWDQNLLEGIVTTLTGQTWFDYVTSSTTDTFINGLTRGFGVFYLLMAILTLILSPRMRKVSWLYYVSSVFLVILAVLYCKEKFYHTGQFLEYAIQFLTPVLFVFTVFHQISHKRMMLYLKVAIALTFISHGMYAFGYYPRPGIFVDMTISILGVSENVAHQFLFIAGILDFAIGIGIFLPRYGQYVMLYAAVWGFATAIARTWAHVDFGPHTFSLLNQYLNQTLYRLCHGLIPLAAYFLMASPMFDQVTEPTD